MQSTSKNAPPIVPGLSEAPAQEAEPQSPAAKVQKIGNNPKFVNRKIIVVLEKAALVVHKPNKWAKPVLLNSDDHQSELRRQGMDVGDARPDIVHQCVLTLLDSPLNKAGHLQVYIRTAEGRVIRINPECRIPRTFKRFSGLLLKLLEEEKIKGDLLEIVSKDIPFKRLLPDNARKIALSWEAKKYRPYNYFKERDDGMPLVVAIGTMASGPDTFADDYADEKVSISDYTLSASSACAKICCALEDLWDVQ